MKSLCRKVTGAAFSLIEVVLALAIVSTILIPIICILALAVSNTQDESSKMGAASIMTGICSDIRSAPSSAVATSLYKLTLPVAGAATSAQPKVFYLDTDYNITTVVTNARYQVNYWTTGSAQNRQESTIRLVISWPAGAVYTNAQGTLETLIVINRKL